MIDKSRLLKSQGSLYLEFIPKDGLFHKMLLLSLMGFLTGWCNLKLMDLIADTVSMTWDGVQTNPGLVGVSFSPLYRIGSTHWIQSLRLTPERKLEK